MEGHMKHVAVASLVIGIIIILVRIYTNWDIWVVIGVLLIIKSILMFKHPCPTEKKK